MGTMAKRKTDRLGRAIGARVNNGSEKTENSEASVLVRGPAELIEGVAEWARAHGLPVAEAWRRAGRQLISDGAATTGLENAGNLVPDDLYPKMMKRKR